MQRSFLRKSERFAEENKLFAEKFLAFKNLFVSLSPENKD